VLSALRGAFGALQNRAFRLLWLGSLCAFISFFTSNVVQQVVAFELTGENAAVGLVVFGRGLAQLVLGPIGGALADRVSKRKILLVCQSITAVVFFGLAALMASGHMRVVHLVIGGFLVGVTFAFLGPTRNAYIVDIVAPEKQGNAVALNQVALNVSRVAGPAVAGFLLAWHLSGATGAFITMALLYVGALGLQSGLPPGGDGNAAPRGVLEDVLDGFRYVRRSPRLRTLVLMFMLVVMLGFPYVTVLPGFVKNQLGLPAKTVSVLFGTTAAGGLAASLWMTAVADSPRVLRYYWLAGFTFGLSLFTLWLARDLTQAAAAMVLIGLTSGCFTTLHGAVILKYTDRRYMGRVMSLGMLAFGAFGLIAVPAGMAADRYGEAVTIAGHAVAICVLMLVLGVVLSRTPEPEPLS
jgi:MFS family permease